MGLKGKEFRNKGLEGIGIGYIKKKGRHVGRRLWWVLDPDPGPPETVRYGAAELGKPLCNLFTSQQRLPDA